jgi:hypothetical protein
MPEQADRWDEWWDTDEGSAEEARAFDKLMKHDIEHELYTALAYVRPLVWAIAQDKSEPPWRKEKAEEAIVKMDSAMILCEPKEPISNVL